MSVNGSHELQELAFLTGLEGSVVNPASIDLTIGNELELVWMDHVEKSMFVKEKYFAAKHYEPVIERKKLNLLDFQVTGEDGSIDTNRSGIWVPPGVGVLMHTAQHVTLPKDKAGLLLLKSSRGREFWQHAMAGWVDNGFDGQLVLEVYAPAIPIHIYAGQRAVQLTVHDVNEGGFSYGDQPDSHYQGQRGVTRSWAETQALIDLPVDSVVKHLGNRPLTEESILEAMHKAQNLFPKMQKWNADTDQFE